MHTCTHCERSILQRNKKEERIKGRISQLQDQLKQICSEFSHEIIEVISHERIPVMMQEYQSYTNCDCDFSCRHQVLKRLIEVQRTIEFKIVTKTCKRCGVVTETQKRRVS